MRILNVDDGVYHSAPIKLVSVPCHLLGRNASKKEKKKITAKSWHTKTGRLN